MAITTPASQTKGSRKRPKAGAKKPAAPREDEIRILAYQLYQQRCADGLDGDAMTDWTEAERLLLRE